MKDEFGIDERNVEKGLNSPVQMHVREVVRALPDEGLSLSWRSELNERLLKEAVRRRKQTLFGWVWKPTAGVALASLVALAFFARMPDLGPVSSTPGVERALVNSYVEGSAAWAVAGDGIAANEAKEAATEPSPFELDREDVGATL